MIRVTRIVVVADPSFATLQLLRDASIDFTVTTDEAALRDAEVILLSPRYGAKAMRGVAGNARGSAGSTRSPPAWRRFRSTLPGPVRLFPHSTSARLTPH